MKVYQVIIDGEPLEDVFTSLRAACKACGVKYSTITKTKDEKHIVDGKFVMIKEADVVKIPGRGSNLNKR